MTREQIANRALRLSKRLEKQYAPRIFEALSKQIRSFIYDYRRYGLGYAKSRPMNTEPLTRVLKDLFKTVIIAQANQTYDELRREARKKGRASMGINEVWLREVRTFLEDHLLYRSVVPISEYTKQILLEAIQKSLDSGYTIEQLITEVIRQTEELNRNRAMMIARTELTTATNVGHMLGAYDSDWQYQKIWVQVKDNRTRYSHRHGDNVDPKTGRMVSGVGGEVVDLEKPFTNGLMYPGDRGDRKRLVPAKEVINCRCVVAFKLKRDSQGNLIPKQKPTNYTYDGGIQRPSLIAALFSGFVSNSIANIINDYINSEQ